MPPGTGCLGLSTPGRRIPSFLPRFSLRSRKPFPQRETTRHEATAHRSKPPSLTQKATATRSDPRAHAQATALERPDLPIGRIETGNPVTRIQPCFVPCRLPLSWEHFTCRDSLLYTG